WRERRERGDVAGEETFYRFIADALFDSKWKRIGLGEVDRRRLEAAIQSNPTLPPVMEGTGGLRKIRLADEEGNRGKSGSYRVCYAYFATNGIVYLVTVFGKGEKDNLNAAEKKAVAKLIRE